ncbi:MAG TPA: hypothetical protein VG755_31985 [Nannocystaceae bacterium]|nr:hypothetical protein [Nannocystaceae bacterium]
MRRERIALAATFVLGLPALGSGWFLDDWLYLDRLAEGGAASELYRLTAAHGGPAAAIQHGAMPWWMDTAAKVELCRPLAGILFAAEHTLFGAHVWAAHLCSVLWFMLLTWAVARLYRRLPSRVGLVALAIFVLDDAHWQGLGWLANRHAVVASAPAMLGLLAWLAHRERHARWGLPLALLGFAIGLAGGESALQVLAFVLAYELWGRRPRRVHALAPVVALVLAYLVLYRALGFGARGHQQYLDPIGEPLRFGEAALVRAPTLLADLVAGMPADLWGAMPVLHPIYVVVGVIATAIVIALVWRVWPRLDPRLACELRWLALGSLGALLPALAGLPGSRLLLVPGIGGAVVLAVLVVHLPASLAGRLARGWIVLAHLVLAPLLLVMGLVNLHVIGRATERIVVDAEVPREHAAQADVVVLYAPDLVALLYPPHMLGSSLAPRVHGWFTLSIAPSAHVAVRTGPHSFTLRALDGPFFASEWERLFRAERAALQIGDRVALDGVTIELIAADELAITTPRALDDPALCLLAWHDGALRRVTLPPVGTPFAIARSPGVLGL